MQAIDWLKAGSLGKRLITVDQVNGYTGYMAWAEALEQGGYTAWGSWLGCDAEAKMRNEALKLIRNLYKNNEM